MVVVLGVAVLALVVTAVVGQGSGASAKLPAAATPSPGDDLTEVDVARVDGATGVPDLDPADLTAPVHTATATCDLQRMEFPPSSTYGVVSDGVSVEDGPIICEAQPLGDGRLIATVGFGTDERVHLGIIDPRRPNDDPQPVPPALSDHTWITPDERIVGAVDHTGEALVARYLAEADPAGSSLVAIDVDSGEEREILAPGAIGGSHIGAAQLRDEHLVVVSGDASAMGIFTLAGIGERYNAAEATEIWFGPADGELAMVRQPTPLPESGRGEDVNWRQLFPPRIVDGADGPLVASFEHVASDDVWQLVLVDLDGASRVVAELGHVDASGRSGQLFSHDPRHAVGRRAGGSFDVVGTQVLIAGTVAADPADEHGGVPTVLLLDLADGSWSRLPVDANVAAFARTDR